MKAYRSKETGLFVGRQVDQIFGKEYETVEVPTNPKEDLIAFLNTIQKVDGQSSAPVASEGEPAKIDWLRQWEIDSAERGKELELAQQLDEAILRAPLQKVLRLAELVYSRLGDFVGKEKQNGTHTPSTDSVEPTDAA